MKRLFYFIYSLIFIIVFSCSKNQIEEEEEEEIVVEPTLFSCVTYNTLLDSTNTEDDAVLE
jgi:hypothetical protein